MSKAKTYTVSNKTMTVKEIETATGVSAKKIRVQLTVKGIKDIKKAVENASSPEQDKAVKKLFGSVKAKASVKPSKKKGRALLEEQRVVVDIMSGTYMIVRRDKDGKNFQKGTVEIFKGTKANPKCEIKQKGMSRIKFLKDLIVELNLPVDISHSAKAKKGTRQLGKDVMNVLS